MTREVTPLGHRLDGLRRALLAAPSDELGNRWAIARSYGVDYLARLDTRGRLIVEEKRSNYGQRRSRRLDGVPEGLAWSPVKAW